MRYAKGRQRPERLAHEARIVILNDEDPEAIVELMDDMARYEAEGRYGLGFFHGLVVGIVGMAVLAAVFSYASA